MPGLQNQFVRILVQCKPITAIAVSRALLNPLPDAAGLVAAARRNGCPLAEASLGYAAIHSTFAAVSIKLFDISPARINAKHESGA